MTSAAVSDFRSLSAFISLPFEDVSDEPWVSGEDPLRNRP